MNQKTQNRQSGSTREYIYQTLKNQIMNLELKPGTKISEKEISETLKVSRTPVRESFLRLAQEELLEIYPQSGTVVSYIHLDFVEEGRFVREKLERAIVKLACEQFPEDLLFQLETNVSTQHLCSEKGNYKNLFELDEEFHNILFIGCNKVRTWKIIEQLKSHFNRIRMLRLVSNDNWDIMISQHKQILEFIKQKDGDRAEKLMKEHLNLVNFDLHTLKQQYPEYFK
ncbi:GntR family transcriptional regulator [Chengkuizengella axinellae]|uniref:GntR family transcriptional regulator n=1 Tax=Chengkuizengella axinellae TaxID=3064388 RepID=A0ABT9IXJ8_9BACL|nr:GntR family transcriptional regulator [Chengkuizengella sp. 2205SS18-9]MDP5274055.1 GntR family transcriptional regulator [Chengkuizengella sp. 2205SS18-9]